MKIIVTIIFRFYNKEQSNGMIKNQEVHHLMVLLRKDSDPIGPFSRAILTYLYTLLHKTTKQEGDSAKELHPKH